MHVRIIPTPFHLVAVETPLMIHIHMLPDVVQAAQW